MIARALPLVGDWFEDSDSRDLWRWVIAAVIVIALHIGAISGYVYLHQPDELGDDDAPIAVDFAPGNDTVNQSQVLPTEAPPPQVEDQPPPPPPPPPEPEQAVVAPPEPPPPPKQEVVPQQQEQQAKSIGGAPRVPSSYLTAISKRIEHYKRYPSKAMAHSEPEIGIVEIGFTVDRTGHVLNHHIEKSSGHPLLDAEAGELLERAQPLPPFPSSMTDSQIDLTLPVTFDK